MGSKIEVPVFVETDLGTRIAMGVSPHITAGDFKSELKRAHLDSFPEHGILTINKMMQVKQKSKFYCLPDSLPLKHVWHGCKKLCFVHVNTCLPKNLEKHSVADHIEIKKKNTSIKHKKRQQRRTWCLRAVLLDLLSTSNARRKKKKEKRRHIPKKLPARNNSERLEQEYLGPDRQTPSVSRAEGHPQKEVSDPAQVSESLSGVISVSGIIDRYYSNLVESDQIDGPWSSEVASKAAQKQLEEQNTLRNSKQHFIGKTTQILSSSPLSEDPNSVVLRNKDKRSEFGERLVLASSTLRLCSNQKFSGSSLTKSRRFLEPDAGSIARSLVFEISDDSEDL